MQQAVLIDVEGRIRNKFENEIKGIYDYVIFLEYNTEIPEGYRAIPVQDISVLYGFYIPKWTGNGWIEGATEEEINLIDFVEPPEPSEIDKLKEKNQQLETQLTDTQVALVEVYEFILGGV